MTKLRKEITKVLTILDLNDRDLRTISIYCNLNNFHHAKMLGGYPNKEVLNELKTMEKENLIFHQKKNLPTGLYGSKNEYILYSLIQQN